MNLVGTEDPMQAGNPPGDGGFDGLLLTRRRADRRADDARLGARVHPVHPESRREGRHARHVGAHGSELQTIRVPAGIAINGKVVWNQDENSTTSAIRPPSDFYGDKIWSYIRSNNLDCQNLAQVAKLGRIEAGELPVRPFDAHDERSTKCAASPPRLRPISSRARP